MTETNNNEPTYVRSQSSIEISCKGKIKNYKVKVYVDGETIKNVAEAEKEAQTRLNSLIINNETQ